MYEKVQDGGNSFYTKYYLSSVFYRWLRPNTRGGYWWDDVAGDSSTQAELVMGQAQAGRIESAGDRDWYLIQLNNGQTCNFDVIGMGSQVWGLPLGNQAASSYSSSPDHPLADPVLEVYNAQGQRLAGNDDGGTLLNASLSFQAPEQGNYYISVSTVGGQGGSYLVGANLSDTITDDHPDSSAQTITVGSRATGLIERGGDVDWFQVSLTQYATYTFQLKDLAPWQPVSSFDPVLYLYDSGGQYVAGDDDGGGWVDAEVAFQPTAAGGWYTLGAAGFSNSRGSYALTARLKDEFGDTSDTSASLTKGSSLAGSINFSGDVDWFKIDLAGGLAYQFDLQGSATGKGSLGDPMLWLMDALGNVLDSADDGGVGANSRITRALPQEDTYYLCVAGKGSLRGSYQISAQQVADDYAQGVKTDGSLTAGASLSGVLNYSGDQDWFGIWLQGGYDYYFQLAGAGGLTRPQLTVYDDLGNQLSSGTTSSGSLRLIQSATSDDLYFLGVSAPNSQTGSYQLSARRDDFLGNSSTTGTASIASPATGEIQKAGDQDWFAVSLSGGLRYRFDLEGSASGQGNLGDPNLRLIDRWGTVLGSADNGGTGNNSRLFSLIPYDDTYFLSAEGRSNTVGTYKLGIQQVTDDYAQGIKTIGTISDGQTVSGVKNWDTDEDWFAISMLAGYQYYLDLNGGSALTAPKLSIYDDLAARITGSTGTGGSLVMTYSPTADGIYFLGVTSPDSATGAYQLTANRDDYLGGTNTNGLLTYGTPISGTVERDGDQDWFALFLSGGYQYQFDLEGVAGGQMTLTAPKITLHDMSGGALSTGNDGGADVDSALNYMITSGGIYYLAASGLGAATGTYAISYQQTPDDYPQGTETSYELYADGVAGYGSINRAGDSDWFYVSLTADQTYYFELRGEDTADGSLPDPKLVLHDSVGVAFAEDNDGGEGRNALLAVTPTLSGLYYLEALGNSDTTGSYAVVGWGDDYAAGTGTTGSIAATDTGADWDYRTGTIEVDGDRDWFRVSLTAGSHTYNFRLQGDSASQGTLLNPTLYLYNTAGGIVASDDDHDGQITGFSVSDYDGEYYVAAASVGDTGTGTYRLAAQDPETDLPADTSTWNYVNIDSFWTGRIDFFNDEDWFRVTLASGTQYSFTLSGMANGIGVLSYLYLNLYSPSGSPITGANNGGNGGPARVSFLSPSDDVYYLGTAASSDWTGTFMISASRGSQVTDDHPADTSTTGVVPMNDFTLCAIETSNDCDWFQVSLAQGYEYTFRLMGWDNFSGSLSYLYFTLYDPSGSPVRSVDNGGNGGAAYLSYSATNQGTYFLGVSAANTGWTGHYLVSASQGSQTTTDDYPADTSTTGYVPIGVPTLGQIDYFGDSDWLQVWLETGYEYSFRLAGNINGSGTLSYLYLDLYDSSGAPVKSSNNGGDGAATVMPYLARSWGWYYLSASAGNDWTGTYQITANGRRVDLANDSTTEGTLSVDSSSTSKFEWENDCDWFKVSLLQGCSYQFLLVSTSSYSIGSQLTISDGQTDYRNVFNQSSNLYTFTAMTTGIFYLTATIDQNSSQQLEQSGGGYKVTAIKYTDDIPSNPNTTACAVVNGPAVTGKIEVAGDDDWFKISFAANTEYYLCLTPTGSNPINRPSFGIRQPDGSFTWGTNVWADFQKMYQSSASGDYYVDVFSSNLSVGGYSLTAISDVYGGTKTTSSLSLGASATGNIDNYDDQDWFKVSLGANTHYIFYDTQITGYLHYPTISLHDSRGVEVSAIETRDGMISDQLDFTTGSVGGTYYLNAHNQNGISRGTYRVGYNNSSSDVPANASTWASLTLGASPEGGTIDTKGDWDWFKVSLQSGHKYQFDLIRDTSAVCDALGDPYLKLYDQNSALKDENDSSGGDGNAKIVYSCTSNGYYYVAAGAAGGSGGQYTGKYQISARELSNDPVDDYRADASTTGVVAIGSPTPGNIERSGDKDWFKVSMLQGAAYSFSMQGSSCSGASALPQPSLRLLDKNGVELWRGDNDPKISGCDSTIRDYYCDTYDYYYLEASAPGDNNTGTYSLNMSGVVVSSVNTNLTFNFDDWNYGTITSDSQKNWYRFTVSNGTEYSFQVLPDSTTTRPFTLRVKKANGDTVAGDANSTSVSFKASENSTYYVEIARSGWSGLALDNSGDCVSIADYKACPGPDGYKTAGSEEDHKQIDPEPNDETTTKIGLTANGVPKCGTINYYNNAYNNDVDCFFVDMISGHRYRIDAMGASTGDGTLIDPYLTLTTKKDGQITRLYSNDNRWMDQNAAIYYTCQDSKRYFVTVSSVDNGITCSKVGTYSLQVEDRTDIPIAVDALIIGDDYKWNKRVITYQISGYSSLIQNTVKDLIKQAFDTWGAAANLDFEPTNNNPDINVSDAEHWVDHSSGHITFNEDGIIHGDIHINSILLVDGSFEDSCLHEIGHVLGLKHPEGSSAGGYTPPYLPPDVDNTHYTIMSYNVGHEADGSTAHGLKSYDLQAINYLYGNGGIGTFSFSSDQSIVKNEFSASFDNGDTEYVLVSQSILIPTDTTHVSSSGTLDTSSSLDWYQVSLSSGCEYHFDLMGSGDDPLADPYLYIYDSAGALVLQDDNSGANGKDAHLDFQCGVGLDGEAGAYYVGVAAADGVSTGTYTLEAWDPPIAGYSENSGLSTTMAATLSQTQGTGTQLGEALLAATTTTSATPLPAAPLAPATEAPSSGGGGSDAPASTTTTTTTTTTTATTTGTTTATTISTLMAAANTQVAVPTLAAPSSAGSATTLVAPH